MIEPDSDTIRRRVEKYYEDRSGFVIHLTVFIILNAIFWGIWLFTHTAFYIASWPWPSIISLAWGSGLAAHWLEFRSKTPGRLARADRLAEDQMADLYGPDWREFADESVYRKLHQAAHQRLRHNTEFGIHLAVFVMLNALLWLLWTGITGSEGPPLTLIVTALWAAGLGAHGASNYFHAARQIVAREKAVQQALAMDMPDKKKRLKQARTLLTDDGELLEVIEDNQEKHGYGILHDAQ